MSKKKIVEKCKCAYCGNEDFDVPNEIIDAIKNEQLVIFAGAGISTEGKNVYPTSFYTDINDELGEKYDNTFPELMTKFCNKPNGRKKLINKIINRFEYYKSFSEIKNVMNQFFHPLSDIYSIKEIITTNWDRMFEEECGCMPVVYNSDIPLLEEDKRKVYKIHGSIDNIGTLIMTQSDYDRCYQELRENLIGGRVKFLLSNKTIVFIGYSLEDEDFRKIWEFIDECLGELKPHFFIISPDENLKEKLKDKNVTVINTIGSNFIEKVRHILIKDGYLLDSKLFYLLTDSILEVALNEHRKTSDRFHDEKNPLIIYSQFYQDGVIHSLKRILSRSCYGEYLNPQFLYNSIQTYDKLHTEYLNADRIFDAAYLCGYMEGMKFLLYAYETVYNRESLEENDTIPLYYLPRKKRFNNKKEFNKEISNYKIKKYINIAEKYLKENGNENFEIEVHHIPFI